MMNSHAIVLIIVLTLVMSEITGAQPPSPTNDTKSASPHNLEDILKELQSCRVLCLTLPNGQPRRVIAIHDGVSLLASPDAAPSRVGTTAAFEIWFVYSEVTEEGWVQLGQRTDCAPSERVWGAFDDFSALAADNRMLMWFPPDEDHSQPTAIRLFSQPFHAEDAVPLGELRPLALHFVSRCFPILATADAGWYEILGLQRQPERSTIRGWINVRELETGELREMLYIRKLELASAMATLMGLSSEIVQGDDPGKVREFIRARDKLVEGQMRSDESVVDRQGYYLLKNQGHKELIYGLTEGWAEQNMSPNARGWFQNGQFYWIPVAQIP